MVEDTINRRIRVSNNTGASVQYQCIREERKLSDMQVQTAIYEYDKTRRLIKEVVSTKEKDGRFEFAATRYEYDRTGNGTASAYGCQREARHCVNMMRRTGWHRRRMLIRRVEFTTVLR